MRVSTLSSLVAGIAVLFSTSAFATSGHHGHSHPVCNTPTACESVLTFSNIVSVGSKIKYDDVAGGGDLTITATGGKLVVVLGELGVASITNWDPRIGNGESIKFSFESDVQLTGWDMDDLNLGGTNKFSLSVDGGATQLFSLSSFTPGAIDLVGKTFVFGYSDKYMIDSLKFNCPDVVTSPVPEPEGYALALAGLFSAGAIVRRRKAAR